ncbi:MAG: 50S ribosomal protein L30 [Thermomicrobiales bacterium]
MSGETIRLTYIKSAAGYSPDQEQTIRSLGFDRLNQTIEKPDTPDIRGMVNKVSHLVTIHSDDEETDSSDE